MACPGLRTLAVLPYRELDGELFLPFTEVSLSIMESLAQSSHIANAVRGRCCLHRKAKTGQASTLEQILEFFREFVGGHAIVADHAMNVREESESSQLTIGGCLFGLGLFNFSPERFDLIYEELQEIQRQTPSVSTDSDGILPQLAISHV